MVSVWWLSCSCSRLSGKWDCCALMSLGVPQQGGKVVPGYPPVDQQMPVPVWGGQGKDRDIHCQKTAQVGPGGKGELLGRYLGKGMSLAQWCQASISTWELQVTQPMSWWYFTVSWWYFICTGQGCSGQFFWDGDRSLKASLPSWRSGVLQGSRAEQGSCRMECNRPSQGKDSW